MTNVKTPCEPNLAQSARWRGWLWRITQILVPTSIIAFLLWRLPPEQWELLRSQPKNYWLLLAALVVALAALAVSFIRWSLLANVQGIRLTITEAFRLGAIGFLFGFIAPGSVGGDLIKAIFLAKRAPGRRVEAVVSVVMDRGCGLLGLLLLGCVALGFVARDGGVDAESAKLLQVARGANLLLLVGIVSVVVLLWGGRPVDRGLMWLGSWPGVGRVIRRFAEPLRAFQSHRGGFLIAVLLSVIVQAGFAVSVFLICLGMYGITNESPGLGEHFVIVPLGMLVSTLPIAPAGLGLFEAAIEWGYHVVPQQQPTASGTLVALVFEVVKVCLAGLGMLFYWTAPADLRETLVEAETSEDRKESPLLLQQAAMAPAQNR